jgi:HlyD family secretion protein
MKSRITLIFLIAPFLFISCNRAEPEADAYGHFEVRETVISAERSGTLQNLTIKEGATIDAGTIVGLIDTTALSIQRGQLIAQLAAVRAKIPQIESQKLVYDEQTRTATTELTRFKNLVANGAASQKQVDDIESQLRLINVQKSVLDRNTQSIQAEMNALASQMLTIDDQIQKSIVINPVKGTVLRQYAEQYELATMGKPIYSIANLDTLDLRVYVTGDQLVNVQPGAKVVVNYDGGSSTIESVDGIISRIADQAEFTPKFLQTREERTSLVYAVVVRVPNNGKLNIGMPAEVRFGDN